MLENIEDITDSRLIGIIEHEEDKDKGNKKIYKKRKVM